MKCSVLAVLRLPYLCTPILFSSLFFWILGGTCPPPHPPQKKKPHRKAQSRIKPGTFFLRRLCKPPSGISSPRCFLVKWKDIILWSCTTAIHAIGIRVEIVVKYMVLSFIFQSMSDRLTLIAAFLRASVNIGHWWIEFQTNSHFVSTEDNLNIILSAELALKWRGHCFFTRCQQSRNYITHTHRHTEQW